MPRASRPRDPAELAAWERTFNRVQKATRRSGASAADARERAREAAWDDVRRARYDAAPAPDPRPVGKDPATLTERVLVLVRERPRRAREVADVLGVTRVSASDTLVYLERTGRVERVAWGLYGAVSHTAELGRSPSPGSRATR